MAAPPFPIQPPSSLLLLAVEGLPSQVSAASGCSAYNLGICSAGVLRGSVVVALVVKPGVYLSGLF
ncbi:hypothetical protein Taro_026505 [Colocasia esculenta]|uniref:Uncharacterized protein n=1 Tax=Colocasia esculenta TaxID=4460 RepID=A0A843VD49_COLES|nr:hypothetical protein [Colocasia esculenta]